MDEQILSNLVRIGTVSAIDAATRRARVQFPDLGMTSGWLFVVQHIQWMPSPGDTVLVLYLPVFSGDGFILGRM